MKIVRWAVRVHVLLLMAFVLLSVPFNEAAQAQGLSFPAQINKSFSPIAIPAGDTSILSITIYNPNSFPLTLSTNPAAWIDDLSIAALNFASPPSATNDCGGIVSTVGSILALSGGTVPAQVGNTPGSCTVTVRVTSTIAGNHINNIPISALHSTDPTGTISVTNTTPASATLQVNSVQPPSLSKTFAPNTIWVGQSSTLTITLRNNDTSAALTQTTLTDTLPVNVVIANPPVPVLTNCGGSASIVGGGGGAIASGDTALTLTNATIAASGTCTVKVNVTSTRPATYTNTIPSNSIHNQQGVTNGNAASAPLNVQAIGISKSFSPNSVQVGSTTTLTITLQNPTNADYTGVNLTDNLPTGLSVFTAPASPQCGGTITDTGTAITLTNGIIPAGTIATPGSCTITVVVSGAIAAGYTNTIPAGAMTTAQGVGNVNAASANLTVYAAGLGVGGSKSFSPATITVGGTSRLTINISAPADTALTNFAVFDSLPIGLQVAATPNPTKNANCVGSTFTAAAGDTFVAYSGGTIPKGATCTLAVNVTSNTSGVFSNLISPSNISNAENRKPANNITANLTVSGISVSKAFAPATVNPLGISTLTITLTNTNTSQIDSVAVTDTLPGNTTNGVVIAPTPNASTTCGAGTLTAVAGAQTITLTNGVLPSQVGSVAGICTITLDVIGKGSPNTYTNTIAANTVSGTIHGTATVIRNPQAATATLQVLAITVNVVKGFDPLTVFGGSSSTMTIQLTNPNSVALTGIAFTDNLPQGTGGGMSVASPANANVGTCGGQIAATPGATAFVFSGGSLAASASCTMTISVTMNVNANLTNTIPIGGVTSTSGASNPEAASATLTNLPGASLSKIFGPNPILAGAGNTSNLTITVQNTGNFQLDGMGLTDTLPAGVTVNGTATTDCNGVVTAAADSISLSGGILAGSSSCTIVVPVTAPTAGNYLNCIPADTLFNNQSATNITAACDTLTVITPPVLSKVFAPTTIPTNATAALTFTIRNPAANTVPLTGVSFTDTFPTGMLLASAPNATQCNGLVTSTSNSVTLSGGRLAVNSTCTVTVSVTAATGGSYDNISEPVNSTNGGTGNTASASLIVIAPPVMAKSFTPNTVGINNTTLLTFTLNNPAENTVPLTGVAFSDTYPYGLLNDTPLTTTNDCGGTLTVVAGGSDIALSGASLPVGGSCSVSVVVIGVTGGAHINTSAPVVSTNGGTGNTATDTLTVAGGGLSLVKSTTRTGYQAVGDTVNYDYLLTNTGTLTLFPPYTVTDDKTSVTCPTMPASLASLDTVTCTATYTIQPADLLSKSVTNTAIATAQDADPGGNTVISNASSVTVRLEALTLIKSTSTTSYRVAGNTITYNYTVTNSGSVTLYAPFNIIDNRIGTPLGTPFTCGSATALLPGGNVTCQKNYTVLAADVSAGSVTNTATASAQNAVSGGNTVTSNQGSVTVYAVIAPTISKVFTPDSIPVGSTTNLVFTLTNPSQNVISLTGVGFTDTFPTGLTVAIAPDAAQCGGTVTSTATSITFSGGTLLPNSSCTVTVLVLGNTNGNKLNTSGAVTSTNGGNGTTASNTLVVVEPPTISKSFSPIATTVGSPSTLTFTLSAPAGNTVALTGVSFTDTFPTGLQVSNPPNSAFSAGCGSPTFAPAAGDTSLNFGNGTLAVDGTCTVTVNVTATVSGTFNNTTTPITSTNGGTGVISNTATLLVDDLVDLSVTKTDGKLAVDRNEVLTYTMTVHNAGPSNTIGATVTDVIPSSLTNVTWTCSAGTGAVCTGSGSGTISDSVDIPVGSSVTYTLTGTVASTATTDIVNTGSVLAPSGVADADISNNSATDSDTLNRLSISKSVSPTTYASVGTQIAYSYTVTNDGTSTFAAPFTVTDDKVTPVCSLPASLAPGASFSCAVNYPIIQADLDAGAITNHVSASGTDADGDTVPSNSATKTITATQSPALSLTKQIASGDPYDTVGAEIKYSYVLKNTGNVTLLSPFTVTDNRVTVSCSAAASLAPNATLTCTATYLVTQPDIDAGSLTNTATAEASFNALPVTSNTAQQTASASQATGLTLVKSITAGNPYRVAGDILNYAYLLTNSGNVTLTGSGTGGIFAVSDDKATVTCPAGITSLAPDSSLTCTASYTVVSADLGRSVTNQAVAQARFGVTPVNSNQDAQTAYGAPVLTITKDDGQDILAPGAISEYSITVTNNSLQAATGIQLVDTVPDGTSFVSATGGGLFDSGTRQITWASFALNPSASMQFTVRLQVESAASLQAASITAVTNHVTVQDDGSHSAGTPVQSQAEDTDQITLNGVKNLTATNQLDSTNPEVLIGEVLEYAINIDVPNGTIANLQAVDILDYGLAFVGCTLVNPVSAGTLGVTRNPCTDPAALTVLAEPITDTDPASESAGRHVIFDFGQVQNVSGSTQTLTLNYRVIVLDIKDNRAGVKNLNNRINWTWSGGILSGAAQSVEIIEPDLLIEKSVSPTVAALGSLVTYTLDVKHTTSSTAPAYDVIVTDNLPVGLLLDPASILITASNDLPAAVLTTTSNSIQVYWSAFPLAAQATITFSAVFIGPPAVINTASVEWASIQIDPAPRSQPQSLYNRYSTERRYDPLDQTINDYRTESSAKLDVPETPLTGFAAGQQTSLPLQPKERAYLDLGDLWLEIPKLGVKISIVGVPLNSNDQWDVTWLGNQAGYLNNTAYPTHAGNSVLTGHVYLANGQPGPFVSLNQLRYGDQIIVHLNGQKYIYQVRENKVISPKDGSVFKHQKYPWLTLITCKDYDLKSKSYLHRVSVGAILINIEVDK